VVVDGLAVLGAVNGFEDDGGWPKLAWLKELKELGRKQSRTRFHAGELNHELAPFSYPKETPRAFVQSTQRLIISAESLGSEMLAQEVLSRHCRARG